MIYLTTIVRNIASAFLLIMLLTACGGSGGTSAGTGSLNLSLTDAPDNEYKAVYITINEVWVKQAEREWEMLTGPELDLPKTLNLLEFVNGFRASLGVVELGAGHYNQMRLILETSKQAPQSSETNILGNTHPYFNYVVDGAENEIFLKVPSGGNTGIKVVNGFDIEKSTSTDIIIDFDAHNSVQVHPAGKSGEWRLRPTVKVVEIDNTVSGVVDDPDAENDSEAWVTAQLYDDNAAVGSKDEVVSVAGVFSKTDGTYFMHLPVNTTDTPYNIVVTKDGFMPECQGLDATASKEYSNVNFTMTPTPSGTVSGSITNLPVPGDGDDYAVFLSIRKFADCDGDDTPETIIELKFESIVNETGDPLPYGPFTLAVGDYELVAWADGAGTVPPYDIVIAENTDTAQEIDFGPNP